MTFGFSTSDFITVIQLSKKVRKQFVDAPGEFNALKTEIKGLSNVLLDLEDLEDLPLAPQLNNEQHLRFDDAKNGCTEVLLDLSKVADKYSELGKAPQKLDDRIRRIWKRLKWEPEDVKQLRARLTSNIALLNAVSNSLQNNITCQVKEGVDKLNREHNDQQRRILADWLAPADFSNQHTDFISRRQKGTGEWLLNSSEYREWRSGTHQTLLCHGIPGAGKTTMSSIIVEDLWKQFGHHTEYAIAYAYCSYKRQNEQTLMNLVTTLVRQLVQERIVPTDALQNLYERHVHRNTRPSVDELRSLLYTVTHTYSRVFIIVDALDECTNTDHTRDLLLSELFHLQAQSKAVVCLLATTRNIEEILNQFRDCVKREIRASHDDISTYINSQISRLAPCVTRRNDLQDDIKTNIIKAVDGMFLLAKLYLDSLIDKTTPKAIRTAVQKMPGGEDALYHAYRDTLERIKCQPPGLRDLAQKVLSWITYSQRPLTVKELQHALAVKFGDTILDAENFEDESQMVSVCAGLVTVDEENKIIRFVHYTTQIFFDNVEKEWLMNAQLEISRSCFAYLSLDTFSSGLCSTNKLFELRLEENCFLNYAAQYWSHHASYVETQLVESILSSFMTKESNLACATQALYARRHRYFVFSHGFPNQVTALHLLAQFGLLKLITVLLENKHHPDLQDSHGQTPLSRAAYHGQEAIVKLLVARDDVEADFKDINGRTPLWWAAYHGRETVVKLLVARDDVEADSKDNDGRTPLWWAAYHGREAIVKLLVARDDVEADSKDNDSRTPLSWAAYLGRETIVKLLLARDDVEADFKDNNGRTPLWWAAYHGRETVVKLLVARDDVEADSKNNDGRTPLWWAAYHGRETIVKLLLARDDVDVNSKDVNDRTPLSLALKGGHMLIVKLLLIRESVELHRIISRLNSIRCKRLENMSKDRQSWADSSRRRATITQIDHENEKGALNKQKSPLESGRRATVSCSSDPALSEVQFSFWIDNSYS